MTKKPKKSKLAELIQDCKEVADELRDAVLESDLIRGVRPVAVSSTQSKLRKAIKKAEEEKC